MRTDGKHAHTLSPLLRVTDRAHDTERETRTSRKVTEVEKRGSQKSTHIHNIQKLLLDVSISTSTDVTHGGAQRNKTCMRNKEYQLMARQLAYRFKYSDVKQVSVQKKKCNNFNY